MPVVLRATQGIDYDSGISKDCANFERKGKPRRHLLGNDNFALDFLCSRTQQPLQYSGGKFVDRVFAEFADDLLNIYPSYLIQSFRRCRDTLFQA